MALIPGTTLGPYEIVAPIGRGGMGEVYKATDTRLDRTVAIKVLPAELASDPERRARFEREAKIIAALNHPHICTLHDVGRADGIDFLVLEHLEGESLQDRLTKGAVPLDQAQQIAIQIADALDKAHRQGITHRDLKPGNVFLTKSGAKLLDFGLAKLKGHGERPAVAQLASAPTRSAPLTAEGTIVGTLQYMAPEQLEAKPADARTDLWALGAILYEMLTGQRAFEATSPASLIGAILEREPAPVSALQPLTPPGLDRLVRKCLAKAPDERWDGAHDVADELRWLRETSGVAGVTGVRPGRRRTLRAALMMAGGVALVAAGAGVTWWLRPSPPPVPLARVSLDIRPAETLNAGGVSPSFLHTPGGSRTALTWTPDGEALVFVGRRNGVQQLYVRRLDAAEARPLAGTDGAQLPAVSADGEWVAFWAAGAIKKVPFGGGPVMDLAPAAGVPPLGLAWADSGDLFFADGAGPLWRIPVEGPPAAVTTVGEGELFHALPLPLPGGRTVLFTVRKRTWSWGDEAIVAQTLATGTRTVLLNDAVDARYLPTGHLVFLRRGVLFAVPFDVERLEIPGPEVPLLDGIAQAFSNGNTADNTGAGQFAISARGSVAWVPGPVAPLREAELVTVDRRGQIAPLQAPRRAYASIVRVSPDGRRLALVIATLAEHGLWRYDLGRGTLTLLAGGAEADWPVWWPDGQRLAFRWLKDGRQSVATQPADGSAPASVLVPDAALYPSSVTPDGRQLAAAGKDGIETDIMIVTVEDDTARVQPFVETPAREQWPAFSPDGRWLAYGSNVSGRNEVYVRPYPGPGVAEQISLEGGGWPAWHPNGREVFFLSPTDLVGKRRMIAVAFEPGSPPRIGAPRVLFAFDSSNLFFACTPVRCYDVAPDGEHFYGMRATAPPPAPVVTHINLIQHWYQELTAKVPVP